MILTRFKIIKYDEHFNGIFFFKIEIFPTLKLFENWLGINCHIMWRRLVKSCRKKISLISNLLKIYLNLHFSGYLHQVFRIWSLHDYSSYLLEIFRKYSFHYIEKSYCKNKKNVMTIFSEKSLCFIIVLKKSIYFKIKNISTIRFFSLRNNNTCQLK